jgi:hypothetical protein
MRAIPASMSLRIAATSRSCVTWSMSVRNIGISLLLLSSVLLPISRPARDGGGGDASDGARQVMGEATPAHATAAILRRSTRQAADPGEN